MSSNSTPPDGRMSDHTDNAPPDGLQTDRTLLNQFRIGSDAAAEALFVRYAERLETLAGRQLAKDLRARVDPDDVVQSVFRTFFRRVSRGDYVVPEGEELWGLLLVIGLNKIRAHAAHHRAVKRNVGNTVSSDAALGQLAVSDESGAVMLRIIIGELVDAMPASHAQIVNLRIEGYEISEIADQTERSKRTVERVLQQFRDRLRDAVETNHERT